MTRTTVETEARRRIVCADCEANLGWEPADDKAECERLGLTWDVRWTICPACEALRDA